MSFIQYVYLIFSWLFGILCIFAGLGLIGQGLYLSSIPFFIASLFLLPPVRSFFYSKSKHKLNIRTRLFVVIVLVATVGGIAVIEGGIKQANMRAEKERLEAEIKQKKINDFLAKKHTILAKIKSQIDNKNYQKAIDIGKSYEFAHDIDIRNLITKAEIEIAKIKALEEAKRKAELEAAKRPKQIRVITLNNRARLCPEPGCDLNKELLRIKTGSILSVSDSKNYKTGIIVSTWYKVKVSGKIGWVSQHDVEIIE